MIKKPRTAGAQVVLILVFSAIFLTLASSFMGYVISQYTLQENRTEGGRAREIAEAGLNYYKWYLAHNPDDATHGTGLPGPYPIPIFDPELGLIGTSTLTIASTTYCGAVSAIDITSTGATVEKPGITRTISARYTRPTVADYSYIINSNVWVGADAVITGPYHSNGGIRMDGTNNSLVTSGISSWTCTGTFGCTPNATRNGVFTTTSNANTALFSFPNPPINFTGLTVDLSEMRNRALLGGGIRLPASGARGYRLNFQSNGTVQVFRVNTTTSYTGYTIEFGDQTEDNVIATETLLATYTIPATCPLIFAEDRLWLGGVVQPKLTVAAASTTSSTLNPSIILQNNITYTNATSSGLLAVAENNVLIGVNVPNNMVINGIFVAQSGRFGRNHYTTADLPAALDPFVFRNSLTVNGTIVSNGRVGTKWTSGPTWLSGFDDRVNTFDRNLVDNPPPLTPNTSDDYVFIDWNDRE
jgi:hypothetical protein